MMRLLKLVVQRLGKMVCLFTTPSMGQLISPQPNVSKKPVESGPQTQDAQEQSKPVAQKHKRKPSVAQAGIKAPSRKRTPKLAPLVVKVHGADGSHLVTLANPSPQPRRKSSAVQSTKLVKSHKQGQQQQGKPDRGSQVATPAPKSRLPVKPAVKAKAARVPSIKAELLSQLEQVVAQTRMELQSGVAGKRKVAAPKIHQPVIQVQTPKRKAVGSTTVGKKPTKSKTTVQTRTARPSKARGS